MLQDDLRTRARQLKKSRAEMEQLRALVDKLVRGGVDLDGFKLEYAALGEPLTPDDCDSDD